MKKFIDKKIESLKKHFNLDISYLLKSAFWTYLDYGGTMILSLILSIFLIRIFNKTEYAEYQFIVALL